MSLTEPDQQLALGFDFGTTRVKATLMRSDGQVVGHHSTTWAQLQCDKRFLSDWLIALRRAAVEILELNPDCRGRIGAVGITAIAPSIVLVQETGHCSAVHLYDEPIPIEGVETRASRSQAVVSRLLTQLPVQSKMAPHLLAINGWLVWCLTNTISLDYSSAAEIFGDKTARAMNGVEVPSLIHPADKVGELSDKWAEELGLPKQLPVVAGGSDSFGLGRAAGLSAGQELIYVGTFFSVMRSRYNFNVPGPITFDHLPYQWFISLPGGAAIERMASSMFFNDSNRSRQIDRFLSSAKDEINRTGNSSGVTLQPINWDLGVAAQGTTPRFLRTEGKGGVNIGSIALGPLQSFSNELKVYFKDRIGVVPITGGLSELPWAREFLNEGLKIEIDASSSIVGAEGAALLGLDYLNRANEISSS